MWNELAWTHRRVVSLDPRAQWELTQDVLGQANGEHTLMFYQIPSEVRGIDEREWSVQVNPCIRDFAVDPGQNLLVVVEKPDEQ